MAAESYEQLVQLMPAYEEYRLYYAQCLYSAFMFPEALNVVSQVVYSLYQRLNHLFEIESTHLQTHVIKLQAAIKYREDDFLNAKVLIEQCPSDDADIEVNLACIDYKVPVDELHLDTKCV